MGNVQAGMHVHVDGVAVTADDTDTQSVRADQVMTWREGMEYWRAWARSTERAADIEEDAARIHAFYEAMVKHNRHPLMLNLDNEMPAEVVNELGMAKSPICLHTGKPCDRGCDEDSACIGVDARGMGKL